MLNRKIFYILIKFKYIEIRNYIDVYFILMKS